MSTLHVDYRLQALLMCFIFASLAPVARAEPAKQEIDIYAKANGFPRSDYPFYESVNACGGEGVTSAVPDKYEVEVNVPSPTLRDPRRTRKVTLFRADFTNACNSHDKCYMTAGKSRGSCDATFNRDLLSACNDPSVENVVRNITLGFTPVTKCIQLAQTYATTVFATGALFYPDAQAKARRYIEVVETFNSLSSPLVFDAEFYVLTYGDLRNAFGNDRIAAKRHWLVNGISEGRISSPALDVRYYLGLYPDLQQAYGSTNFHAAVKHWLKHGVAEGRRSSIVFDPRFYLSTYPDLQTAFGPNNFSAAVDHWLRHGVQEGRKGSPDFDPRFYLASNPDVARVYGEGNFKGAVEHYLEFGQREGRRGVP